MSPSLLAVAEEEGQSNVTLLSSPTSAESVCEAAMELKERNYMGLSDCSSVDSSVVSDENKTKLNLRATELRLGLPGSQSPGRNQELSLFSSTQLDEKPFFPLYPSNDGHCSTQKTVVSGSKRGFADAMNGFSEGEFFSNSEANAVFSPRPANLGLKPVSVLENLDIRAVKSTETGSSKIEQEKSHVANKTRGNNTAKNSNGAPVAKAQVVGWPPIKSFRKNSLATSSKNNEEVDGKEGPGALFVKVSMDGAPYLRKVDLRNYSAYQELSSALEKMFSCFTIGHYGSHGASERKKLCESKLKDLLHCTEYVLTYEDKDGDWMLVGDVPWEMFIDTCKRLRIRKGSDAIGLAPRMAAENCKN